MSYENSYLEHHGIKGQKWGLRRFQNVDGSLTAEGKERYLNSDGTKNYKKIKKDAAADAKEYARAKAYYGDGAGIRRKKIKNAISEKMKDPDYKKEFELQLANQNMSEHQVAANRERKIQNTKDRAARVGRGIKNLVLGVGTTSLTAIALYNAAKITGADKAIASYGKKAVKTAINYAKSIRPGNAHYGSRVSYSNAFAEYMKNR